MSNAASVLDLDAFRRRREAARAATSPLATSPLATSPLATSPLATSPLATSPLATGAALSPVPVGATMAPQSLSLAGWSTMPVAWAPMYVWMPVLMVLG